MAKMNNPSTDPLSFLKTEMTLNFSGIVLSRLEKEFQGLKIL